MTAIMFMLSALQVYILVNITSMFPWQQRPDQERRFLVTGPLQALRTYGMTSVTPNSPLRFN